MSCALLRREHVATLRYYFRRTAQGLATLAVAGVSQLGLLQAAVAKVRTRLAHHATRYADPDHVELPTGEHVPFAGTAAQSMDSCRKTRGRSPASSGRTERRLSATAEREYRAAPREIATGRSVASSPKRGPTREGPRTMAEKIDQDATVTDTIDRMIQAIVDQIPLAGEDRVKVKIALCDAIAETYSEKAQQLRLLLTGPSGVS
jgi:hypothetical protein